MPKLQQHFRLSEETIRKVNALCKSYGTTKTEVITIAVARLYEQESAYRLSEDTRALTTEEIAFFPGDAPVNVAIRRIDGNWYYGNASLVGREDGSFFIESVFVTEANSSVPLRYIPVLQSP